MTTEEAMKNLYNWLDIAAHSPTHNRYDDLCDEAYQVLGETEYENIWKRWANGYVSCSDGSYRRR